MGKVREVKENNTVNIAKTFIVSIKADVQNLFKGFSKSAWQSSSVQKLLHIFFKRKCCPLVELQHYYYIISVICLKLKSFHKTSSLYISTLDSWCFFNCYVRRNNVMILICEYPLLIILQSVRKLGKNEGRGETEKEARKNVITLLAAI